MCQVVKKKRPAELASLKCLSAKYLMRIVHGAGMTTQIFAMCSQSFGMCFECPGVGFEYFCEVLEFL